MRSIFPQLAKAMKEEKALAMPNILFVGGDEMVISRPVERVVIREVDKFLSRHGEICACEQCRKDIIALALQNLPPRYSTTKKGEVWINVELQSPQLKMDVLKAILRAADRVTQYPRHDA
ncbi:MAG: late competence development ComFB family protein [Firmicutes bacterium]|nr:late competence development ComFB family protein [Bacillota bacterium]